MSDAPGQFADAPLIAVILDALDAPQWIADSVTELSRRQARVLVIAVDPAQPREGAWSRHRDTALERTLLRRERAAVIPVAVAGGSLIGVKRLTSGELDAALRDVDIIVDLSRGPVVRAQGTQVVVTALHGATKATSPTVLVRELLAGRRTVITTVVARDAAGRSVAAAEARTALIRRSATASRSAVARKFPALLLRVVDSVMHRDIPSTTTLGADEPVGNPTMALGIAKLAVAAIRSFIAARTTESRYAVAWGGRNPSDSPLELPTRMHWVDHPRDRFLADPFLARHDNQTFVFVEDFSRSTGYATIGVFEPRAPAATFRTVLDRGTHLSYPFVFREEEHGDWLMLPEMAAENRLILFRASSFPDEWIEDTVLLEGVSAYDPTVIFRDGRFWLFYTPGTSTYCPNDELVLAFSDTLRGPYTQHPLNPIKSDVIGSRPAGRLFDWNGRLIRPAQDSSREYGYAVVFNEVTELTPATFAEQPIGRLEPDWAPGIRSSYFWYFLEDIVVADAKRVEPSRAAMHFKKPLQFRSS